MKILLVDDSLTWGRVVQYVLDQDYCEHELHHALTASEAVEMLTTDFDLIILDIFLPDTGGLNLMSMFKNHARVVTFSAAAGEEGPGFKANPKDPGRLLEVIKEIKA